MRDALGQWYTYTFDRNGNLTSSKDPSTALTTNQYDNLDRREVTIDALAYRTTITYDRASNRTSIMDPRRNITTWNYDELGADSLKSSCCAIITFIEGMAYDFRGA